ncbi:MAG: hypothetical protein IPL52_17975 [Flavobacteriales bacterium]|nr:hypothetical protein [Flavobacteriales bacterium]
MRRRANAWKSLGLLTLLFSTSLRAQPYVENLTTANISVQFYFAVECDDVVYYTGSCQYLGANGTYTYPPPFGYVFHGLKIFCGECVGGTIVASASCLGGSEEFYCGTDLIVRGGDTRVVIDYN